MLFVSKSNKIGGGGGGGGETIKKLKAMFEIFILKTSHIQREIIIMFCEFLNFMVDQVFTSQTIIMV